MPNNPLQALLVGRMSDLLLHACERLSKSGSAEPAARRRLAGHRFAALTLLGANAKVTVQDSIFIGNHCPTRRGWTSAAAEVRSSGCYSIFGGP